MKEKEKVLHYFFFSSEFLITSKIQLKYNNFSESQYWKYTFTKDK
jgi:hypothetical protein